MSVVGSSLMKRGFEVHTYLKDKNEKIELPPWVVAILAVTSILFILVIFTVEYTFGRVIPTLLMIESPQDTINFEPIPSEEDDGMTKNVEPEPEPTTTRPQFITSSFRRSIQLLRSKGGFRGRYRGLWMYIAHNTAVQWLAGIMRMSTGNFLPISVYTVIAAVACAQLSLGWTLIVITEASPKYWFRRIPSFSSWKKIAGPTAMYAVAEQLAVMAPLCLAFSAGLTKEPKEIEELPLSELKAMILKGFGIFILGLVLSFFLILPGNIILTRMQASLVSDAEDTIVPFDRTFGGNVVPQVVGGTGMIGIVDAWKTFDWSARVRLVKTYAKVIAMLFGVFVFFTIILVSQVFILAPHLQKVVPENGN